MIQWLVSLLVGVAEVERLTLDGGEWKLLPRGSKKIRTSTVPDADLRISHYCIAYTVQSIFSHLLKICCAMGHTVSTSTARKRVGNPGCGRATLQCPCLGFALPASGPLARGFVGCLRLLCCAATTVTMARGSSYQKRPAPGSKPSYHQHANTSNKNNPKRGAPGILLTCETGRDGKAKREGLAMLQQDWDWQQQQQQRGSSQSTRSATTEDGSAPAAATTTTTTDTSSIAIPATTTSSQRLDEELDQLQQRHRQQNSPRSNNQGRPSPPFQVYETGCKGTVFVLCTGSRLLVPPRKTNPNSISTNPDKDDDNNNNDDDDDDVVAAQTVHTHGTGGGPDDDYRDDTAMPNKKLKPTKSEPDKQQPVETAIVDPLSDTTREALVSHTTTTRDNTDDDTDVGVEWDPLEVVGRIVADLECDKPMRITSRFITRMIPIQASCYSSVEDIQHAVANLIERALRLSKQSKQQPTTTTTFAIQEKRRFCGHLTHDQIIDAVASVVSKATVDHPWKVNLNQPDYTIWIDICKTVAGVSIIPASQLHPKNFNVAERKDAVAEAARAAEDAAAVEPATGTATTSTNAAAAAVTVDKM